MTDSSTSLSLETLTLPHDDPAEHRRLHDEWRTGYPEADPIEQGYIDQAVAALVEKRQIEGALGVLRADKVRTAERDFDRAQADHVYRCKQVFPISPERAIREMTQTAAGCFWTIKWWEDLDSKLATDGTWYFIDKFAAIMLRGQSACLTELILSQEAYTIWLDCLACTPNPKQEDIDQILAPAIIPKGLRDRDVVLWPRNPAECRARLKTIVDEELPRLRALEKTLRDQYELPARAEARQMALAKISREEMTLLRAAQMAEQSYDRAVAGLIKARKQTAATRRPVVKAEVEAPEVEDPWLVPSTFVPAAAVPAPAAGAPLVVGRSEHRSPVGHWGAAKFRNPRPPKRLRRRPRPGL